MSQRTIHIAAEPIGDVQDCARCGRVLMDNRGLDVDGERWILSTFFPVGSEVAEGHNGQTFAASAVIVRAGLHTSEAMNAERPADTPCTPTPETP